MGTTEGRSDRERLLTAGLAVLLLVLLAGVAYVAVTPGATSDPYTEFYVLGENGSAAGYPTDIEVGETGHVLIGIANEENRDTTYTVVLSLDDEEIDRLTVTLENGESWEERAAVTPTSVGQQHFRVDLYRGASVDPDEEPYRQTGIWIDVSP